MNILITGGMGFIGSYLSNYLFNKDNKISIYDNFSNSPNHMSESNFKIIHGDILDRVLLSKSLKTIDIVIHLAAQISVTESLKNPENTIKINVQGTQNILDACLENNIKNFIAISTAAVFGNQDIMPLTEHSKTCPISAYGKSKLLMEKKIVDFSKNNNFNSIILRFFNLYGLGQSSEYAGVITKFLQRITENKPLEIYGTGNQTRDFLHIDDAVKCIDLAIRHLDGNVGKIYNVGTGNCINILNLAHLLLKLSRKELPINFKSEIKGDILNSETSIDLVKKELGFQPKILLEEGLGIFVHS